MPTEKDKKALTEKAKLIEKKVGITRVNPENIKPIFTNDFLVSHTEEEFFFIFSILEPVQIVTEEELDKIKSVEAIARVKLVLTPDFTKRVSEAIIKNIEGYEKRFKQNGSEIEPGPKKEN